MIRDPIGDLGGFAGPITNHVLSQSQFKIDDVSRRPYPGGMHGRRKWKLIVNRDSDFEMYVQSATSNDACDM